MDRMSGEVGAEFERMDVLCFKSTLAKELKDEPTQRVLAR